MLSGPGSLIFPSNDLDADKAFWTTALGVEPYFDEPFYVGFTVDGREVGLDPHAAAEGLSYPVSYWTTTDIQATRGALIARGAFAHTDVKDVGQGVLLATLRDRTGNVFGLIQRP